MRLSDAITVRPRFARSVNIELDAKASRIEGYLPTGRALDVVRRVARGLDEPSAGRALSITGPHGTGKSSLAVFLDALCSPPRTAEHQVAWDILATVDGDLASSLASTINRHQAGTRGCVRATVTAEREPVTVTIARALHHGAERFYGHRKNPVPTAFADSAHAKRLTSREIRAVLGPLCERAPVLLVVDEFGKNLEAYAESSREADPFLLQELAEWSHGPDGLPLIVITMQHLAFDEYVQETSTTRRREWVKVQGRFEDIPYVETAGQARRLIAATFTRASETLDAAIDRWYRRHSSTYRDAGLRALIDGSEARAAYPLHPLSLAVLPDLCSRYGQNERTMFSFLAGAEPLAVPALLATEELSGRGDLPFVRLDRVYDYFVDSAATMIGSAATASRWVEIETRIRDTHGLADPQLRALKTIGVLNLVSTGGALRASTTLLRLALGKGKQGTRDDEQVDATLASLETAGLITYRDFADEYRIWQGSDFDLRTTVELARRRCRERPLAALLNDAAPLEPVVAGRHSQRTGTLRVFERRYSDLVHNELTPLPPASPWDGILLYATTFHDPPTVAADKTTKPILAVVPNDVEAVRDAAIEAAALVEALRSAEAESADWVARRELIERVAIARQRLAETASHTWDPTTSRWLSLTRTIDELDTRAGVSPALSNVCDAVYPDTPPVGNEMLARRNLTSQGAKARRMLVAAMLTNPNEDRFGIEGYGPHRAMYESVFRASGIHRTEPETDDWVIAEPTAKAWKPAWRAVLAAFKDATERRIGVDEVQERLQQPPVGLKEGPIPVLVLAALAAHADEIAVYEHGTLVLAVDDAVAERLARNPGHFAVKNIATETGPRREVVAAIAERLGITSYRGQPTFLHVARALYGEIRSLPAYTQQTTIGVSDDAVALRKAFRYAGEPDVLLFETLPELFNVRPFSARGPIAPRDAAKFADRLADVIRDLRAAYPRLLADVAGHLAESTRASGELPDLRQALGGRAADLAQRVLEPRLKTFVYSLGRDGVDDDEWLENIAMVVADGQPPSSWSDDIVAKYRLNVDELGGALRRVQALLFEQLAGAGAGFRPVRATFTHPDGHETTRVVAMTEPQRAELDGLFTETLNSAAERVGSTAAARDLLLAWIADTDDAEAADTADRIKEARGG